MMDVLLDTNAYSLLFSGDAHIQKELDDSNTVFLSVVTIGELYAGFYRGTKVGENEKQLRSFLDHKRTSILYFKDKTALIYGKFMASLYKRGFPIPTNDVWLAAQAFETKSKLITYDKHFLKIPELRIWSRLTKVD